MNTVDAPLDPADTHLNTVDAPLDPADTRLDSVGAPLDPAAPEVTGVTRDGIVVGPMKRRHLRAVTAIERAANTHPWSQSLFASELRMPTSRHWLVARDSRQVVGFAGLMWNLDEGHVTNFAVHGDHRRQHVATRMLIAQCSDAINLGVTALTLEVRMSNVAARGLYGRFGFSPGGVRRGYYNDNGEDALIMWAHDIDGPAFGERLATLESAMPVRLVREAM